MASDGSDVIQAVAFWAIALSLIVMLVLGFAWFVLVYAFGRQNAIRRSKIKRELNRMGALLERQGVTDDPRFTLTRARIDALAIAHRQDMRVTTIAMLMAASTGIGLLTALSLNAAARTNAAIPVVTILIVVVTLAAIVTVNYLFDFYNPTAACLVLIRSCIYAIEPSKADFDDMSRDVIPSYRTHRATERLVSRLLQRLPTYVLREAGPVFPELATARVATALAVTERVEARYLGAQREPRSERARRRLLAGLFDALDLLTGNLPLTAVDRIPDRHRERLEVLRKKETRTRVHIRIGYFLCLIVIPLTIGLVVFGLTRSGHWDVTAWFDPWVRLLAVCIPLASLIPIIRRRYRGEVYSGDDMRQTAVNMEAILNEWRSREGKST